jgi:acyl carrier protein
MEYTARGERLIALISEILRMPPQEIVDSLDMEATGTWDSLSHMELIAAIEDEFGVDLSADEIVSMRSVADIRTVLRAKQIAV